MGVEFQKVSNKVTAFLLDDSTMGLIKNTINCFNDKYDDVFDYHGTFRLYKNHQECLRELLTPFTTKSEIIADFIVLLDECIETETVLIGIGD